MARSNKKQSWSARIKAELSDTKKKLADAQTELGVVRKQRAKLANDNRVLADKLNKVSKQLISAKEMISDQSDALLDLQSERDEYKRLSKQSIWQRLFG